MTETRFDIQVVFSFVNFPTSFQVFLRSIV